jgi:Fe(3+) dicitrate transport protein
MKIQKLASMLASTSIAFSAFADDHGEKDQLSPFNVIGTKADVPSLQGSGTVLDSSDLKKFKHTDIHDILRQVPGVYVRGEEGYGFFPNISMRGVDPNRSNKITILEDGVPSSPAPYADPAAYYAPTAGRMAGFELLKGSSSLKYGPNNTGGVINYLSTAIPEEQSSYLRASYGSYNERISHAYSGGKSEFGSGKLGYLLEVFDHRSDGWKTIQNAGGEPTRDAPIAKTDLMLKLSYDFADGDYLEFKAGRMDMDADVSYQGLSKTDFDANPYSRYAGTNQDNMDAEQQRYYLRYLTELSDELTLSTTAYYNEFSRNWYKLAKSANAIVDSTGAYTANSVFDSAGLTGVSGTSYQTKANDRTYETKGIQGNLNYESGMHNIDLGFRYQEDHYFKNAWRNPTYTWQANGGLLYTPNAKSAKDPYKDAEALEVYLSDDINLGNLTVSPGIRYSSIDYTYSGANARTLSDTLLGVGAVYAMSDTMSIFGGVHQGHSFPDAESASTYIDGTDVEGYRNEEKSLNFEFGIRGSLSKVYYELVYFNTSLEDMLALKSASSNTDRSFNMGEASIQGLEVLLGTDLGENMGFGIPVQLSATFTDSEYESVSAATSGYLKGGVAGATLPFIPDTMLNLSGGLEFEKSRTYLNYHYQDQIFTSGYNKHTLGAYGVLNWSGFYDISDNVTLFSKVTNLTDEVYAQSTQPGGLRPGQPRVWSFGMEFDF